ncbi:heavy metal-responsive transcriptional regulator [Microcoleus sp. Pol11C3]|uniref:heavy metal-responsive transcriptional regulator n=1 Tax=Microcoleus sp. Pol11C3 TaxID=3055390 RepID=UPI002FD18165
MTKLETESLEQQLLKIGELAKQTGVAVGTLRYYESLGLLEPALRSSSGYRYYTADAARQVQFIKKAQRLNFSLQEIQQILVSRRQGMAVCPLVQDLLSHKIDLLEEQIQQMNAFKGELEAYKKLWTARDSDNPDSEQLCSLIEGV